MDGWTITAIVIVLSVTAFLAWILRPPTQAEKARLQQHHAQRQLENHQRQLERRKADRIRAQRDWGDQYQEAFIASTPGGPSIGSKQDARPVHASTKIYSSKGRAIVFVTYDDDTKRMFSTKDIETAERLARRILDKNPKSHQ